MEFGFSLPSRGPMATPEHIATLAHKGEEMGFGILAVSAHIIMPTRLQSTHPYSASGQFDAGAEAQGEYLEPLALLSFLAGITSSAKLLTAVLVPPHPPPGLTAKMLATVDVLSPGRGIVGGGGGGVRGGGVALDAPPVEGRRAGSNEYMRALREPL